MMDTQSLNPQAAAWTWFSKNAGVPELTVDIKTHSLALAAHTALAGDLSAWENHVKRAETDIITQGAVTAEMVSHLSMEGTRPPLAAEGQITMETAAGSPERALMVFRTAPQTPGMVYWFKLRIDSAAEDQCQFRLISESGYEEEIIRIKPSSFVMGRSQELNIPMIGHTRLTALVVDGHYIHLYMDGILCYRRARSRAGRPSGFLIDMNTSATHDGRLKILAMGVGSLDQKFGGFTPTDDAVPANIAANYLAAGMTSEFGKITHAVQDLDIFDYQDVLRDGIIKMESSRDLSRRWITRPILSNLHGKNLDTASEHLDIHLQNPMVKAENLGVKFLANPAKAQSLFGMFSSGEDRKNMLQVFQDISFDLYSGDTLGIIGHNGAGKTTLLRTIAGVIGLSTGRVQIRGQSILLRPGAGMREDLTGRQNILLGGIFMGHSIAQSKSIIDDVIEFSELGEAIDRPYRYYSDGMRSRLVFSIATAIPPDILMLDELLGAGDLAFQEKANERLSSYISKAKVVIVVEHSLGFVNTKCNKVLYIGRGHRIFYGDPQIAVTQYMSERECEDENVPYGHPIYERLATSDS